MVDLTKLTNIELVQDTLQKSYDSREFSKNDIEEIIEQLVGYFPAVGYSNIKIKYREEDIEKGE